MYRIGIRHLEEHTLVFGVCIFQIEAAGEIDVAISAKIIVPSRASFSYYSLLENTLDL